MSDAMPERVWLDPQGMADDEYEGIWYWKTSYPEEVCYVPESRALRAEAALAEAERERDDALDVAYKWNQRVNTLRADLRALAGYADTHLSHMEAELAAEGAAPSPAMDAARDILDREGT